MLCEGYYIQNSLLVSKDTYIPDLPMSGKHCANCFASILKLILLTEFL